MKAYNIVRNFFNKNLPHESTVRAWYANSNIDCKPGINRVSMKILKQKAEQKKEPILVSLLFDEMFMMKLFQWCNPTKHMYGFPTYGSDISIDIHEANELNEKFLEAAANQAIVFMASGINEKIRIPIAYHFIRKLKAEQRVQLFLTVIDALEETGVIVVNVTCDGLITNRKAFKILGANLDPDSEDFRPYFVRNGKKIFIIMDVCHMEKLIRGCLDNKQVIEDSNGCQIRWKHYEDLMNFDRIHGFNMVHKLTKNHIQWKSRKMNVRLAVELLSNSTADAFQFLFDEGIPQFSDVKPTITFTRMFDKLFDVFNSKNNDGDNPLKNVMSSANKDQIAALFREAIPYIKGLRGKNESGKMQQMIKSRLRTGFVGYIINMVSLMNIYKYYIEEKKMIDSIPTYSLCQDALEIFFGKIRSHNGCNDNPTQQQFISAYRKILVYSTVLPPTRGNCTSCEPSSPPLSNILFVTSRRATISNDYPDEPPPELEDLRTKLEELERVDRSSLIDPTLSDITIKHIANIIEERIGNADNFCENCSKIFDENDKVDQCFIESNNRKPCISTYRICKQVDRYLKFSIISGEFNFNTIYYAICEQIQIELLYPNTNFLHNTAHKLHIIRAIIDSYVQIKGTFLAKSANLDTDQEHIRTKLRKLIHIYGQ